MEEIGLKTIVLHPGSALSADPKKALDKAKTTSHIDTMARPNVREKLLSAGLDTLLRQAPERTVDGLWRRIGALLDQFTPGECRNYFRAAGYRDSF